MTNYLIVPGLGNSGPTYWQNYFEQSGSNFFKINQQEWEFPNCEDWITTIGDVLAAFDPANVVLIRHIFGCLAITHWADKYKKIVRVHCFFHLVMQKPSRTLSLQQAFSPTLSVN